MIILKAIYADITTLKVDAIVNAANQTLLGGGGVDGAIHRAAGPGLLQQCKTLGGCEVGDAKITSGYYLKARYVIHAVGPVWRGGKNKEDQLLSSCYAKALALAGDRQLSSMAFPCISTGAYHFPKERAVSIAIKTVKQEIRGHSSIRKVIFACYSQNDFQIYQERLKEGDF